MNNPERTHSMSNVCHVNSYSASKKSPANQNISKNNVNTENDSDKFVDEREEIEDKRHFPFTMIDNDFISAGFDSDTIAVYLRIVWRAANNSKGFFENRDTTASILKISKRQLDYCRRLLEFCNIIKINQRFDTITKKQQSSIVTLIDKNKWNLNHDWRKAGDFGRRNDRVHPMHGEGASHARDRVHPVRTEQDPDLNKITNKQDHKNTDLSVQKKNNRKPREIKKGDVINYRNMFNSIAKCKFYNDSHAEMDLEEILRESNSTIKQFNLAVRAVPINPELGILFDKANTPESFKNAWLQVLIKFTNNEKNKI